jgi:hypothetical protein
MTRMNSWTILVTLTVALAAGLIGCASATNGSGTPSGKPVLTLKGAAQ